MISIIVVGRNEGWRLTKCLESIEYLSRGIPEIAIEILYVDSDSTDDSIERAKEFVSVDIYKLTGEVNSAIARNVGAENSKGEILFFVDGDMEVEAGFLEYVILHEVEKNSILTGHVDDYFYTGSGEYIKKSPRTYVGEVPSTTERLVATGGLMLVHRDLWRAVGGMRTKYKRSQDLDFCLRAQRDYQATVQRLPRLLARHHTVEYGHEDRMWDTVAQGYHFYPALLFREHMLSVGFLRWAARRNWGGIFLTLATLLSLYRIDMGASVLALYLMLAIAHTILKATSAGQSGSVGQRFSKFVYKLAVDLSFLLGLFIFFPKNKCVRYQKIRDANATYLSGTDLPIRL